MRVFVCTYANVYVLRVHARDCIRTRVHRARAYEKLKQQQSFDDEKIPN